MINLIYFDHSTTQPHAKTTTLWAYLLGSLSNVPGLELGELNTQSLYYLILYGNQDLTLIANRMIMEATINFIKTTKRFEV